MSVRITPESPPPEEKFPRGLIRVIPLERFGDGAGDPGRLPERSFLCMRGCYRMDCRRLIELGSDRSALKPRKRRETTDSKGSKKLPNPRLDPEFDSKDPLGLSW